MAFYKDAPGSKKKTNYAFQGSWDDEGTHYNGARRFGPESSHGSSRPQREDYRDGRASYAGNRDDRRDNGRRFERSDRNDRSEGFRGRRDDFRRDDRRDSRPSDRRPRPERRPVEVEPVRRPSYRDAEFHPAPAAAPVAAPVTPVEEAVMENLLAGRNPIREALRAGRDIEKLLVQRGELSGSAREIVQLAREMHITVQEVDKARLDEIARNHQGMLAFASAYKYSTVEAMLQEAEEKGEAPFLILLDGVTDPHNLGAIIRSAECVGAHGVIVPERRSVGLTPAAVKASAGAVEHMKVARVVNLNRTIDELKEKGVWTYALTMDGEDYERVNFDGGVALIVGSEGEGVSRLTLENCDVRVSLPMAGSLDSLNASVAAGVMMYRVFSSRRK